jgi:endonuclease YncB( thermonuclease family)
MWLFYAAISIFTDMEYLMNHIVEPQTSKSKPYKPYLNRAKRLAKTKGMSREQWLQVRKQGIGSSDAAAACGLNPHMSMLELWMIKTGRMQNSLINRPKTVIHPYIGAISLNP